MQEFLTHGTDVYLLDDTIIIHSGMLHHTVSVWWPFVFVFGLPVFNIKVMFNKPRWCGAGVDKTFEFFLSVLYAHSNGNQRHQDALHTFLVVSSQLWNVSPNHVTIPGSRQLPPLLIIMVLPRLALSVYTHSTAVHRIPTTKDGCSMWVPCIPITHSLCCRPCEIIQKLRGQG